MFSKKMRQSKWTIVVLVLIVLLLIVSYFFRFPILILVSAVIFLALIIANLIHAHFLRKDTYHFLKYISSTLDLGDNSVLSHFPLPVVVVHQREILWYSDRFREMILSGCDVYGESLDCITNTPIDEFYRPDGIQVDYRERHYHVYGFETERDGDVLDLLYFIDDTELVETAQEYIQSRPIVMILVIDNYDELVQNAKESEKSQIIGEIDTVIENYFADTSGFVKRLNQDRFLALVEERHYQQMVANRFDILDRVRKIVANDRVPATLSIGVGRDGKDMSESEMFARQSLDMALGRGGDQVAVKTVNGYDFYGGMSKGIEKHTRVKSRIIAAALVELIEGADNVVVMGHKASDLDCVGAAIAMAQAVRRFNKPAIIAIDREHSLATTLIDKFNEIGRSNLFVHPDIAADYVNKNTLLIILDTHNPKFVESERIYRMCKNVVVIDHHRKMVNYIDNAVIFHHEPYASSASEMVTELIQYFGEGRRPSREEAEALLAGIMLDTRNFSLRTGVRTFEAAAYLRRVGADTVAVRKLFANTIDAYQKKTQLVQKAEVYRNCAIAISDFLADDLRVVAPQAADELLGINDVDASFVIYPLEEGMSISARSMGDINVQVIMEYLGGGGHHTMAGAQLRGCNAAEAKQKLTEAIDKYYENNKQYL